MPFAVQTDRGRKRVAPARPGSLRQRLGTGNLRFGELAVIVVLGTVACFGGLLALDQMLVGPPAPTEAGHRAEGLRFTVRDLGDYVGHWISDKGAHLIVTKSGAVWADGGSMLGAAALDARDRTRLLFSGPGFRCAYSIRAEQPGALVWLIDEASEGAACPVGRYSRRFTF